MLKTYGEVRDAVVYEEKVAYTNLQLANKRLEQAYRERDELRGSVLVLLAEQNIQRALREQQETQQAYDKAIAARVAGIL